ncbi:4'-phosphopantetheinyl transferase superfamily protein [Hymenobacter oligotrophus]|uniref:4'-phosphopantetheinyl transferase superfamily protein n=1 Tax=Hymenobacter oligotrophus TaxID=2319843 RepID=A0A3B7QXA1_9BACT|nr:4'-phosphopantetheinyl transferase superfamily protein [Hymenobacter oligotrophus]AYA36444.1 4'-phosphopantetheinyl transferase superfamily protein [Hymenobacter oligotrophus]
MAAVHPHLPAWEAVLSPDERARAQRYRQAPDAARFVVGRGLLRLLLAHCLGLPARGVALAPRAGKPMLQQSQEGQHFNVAHSGEYVLVALAPGPVGIDVEQIADYDPHCRAVAQRSFAPAEYAWLQQADVPAEAFGKLWTRKEALAKAVGTGIDAHWPHLPSLDGAQVLPPSPGFAGRNWAVHSFAAAPGYAAAVAHETAAWANHPPLFVDVDASLLDIAAG